MKIDGLWTARYFGLRGWANAGVVILESGRMIGGNNHHIVLGSYQVTESDVTMNLEINFFDSPDTIFPVRKDTTPFKIEGKWEDDTLQGTATRTDIAGFNIPFCMVKRLDLP